MAIQLINITKYFGDQLIFEQLNLTIHNRQKIALVGRNGAGKTTLLNIINKQLLADAGEVIYQGNIKIGDLKQVTFNDLTKTLYQEMIAVFADVIAMKKQLDELALALKQEPDNQELLNRLAHLQNAFEYQGGYHYEEMIKQVVTGFKFSVADLEKPLAEFSGGEKTRLAFAKLLLMMPDILLLDEPTNHLDIDTIEWLEKFLANYPKAVIITSHDRLFLDRICQVVIEIANQKAVVYQGNYSSYLAAKKARLANEKSAYERQQKEIERLELLIDKFRAKKNLAKMAKSKQSYLDRMEKIEAPNIEQKAFKASFHSRLRGGNIVLTLDNLQIGYQQLLMSLSLQIMRGDKIAVVGPNGCGKSTLLKTIVNEVAPLGGEMLLGHQIEIGYFEQNLMQFNESNTVLEELWNDYPHLDKTKIRTVLGTFLFRNDDVFKLVANLSGGEKVRLQLCKLMLQEANFLILDEPTNHLDIESKEALEEALLQYDGTILFVSHDRYFIDKLANGILSIKDGNITLTKEDIQVFQQQNLSASSENSTKESANFSGRQQYEWQNKLKSLMRQSEQLLLEIEKQQTIADDLRALRFEEQYYHDFKEMDKLNQQIDEQVNVVANLEKEWLELSEMIERLQK